MIDLKKLMFEINGQYRQYTVIDYIIKNDFYLFTDIKNGEPYKLHKKYFTGEAPMPNEASQQ